MKHLRWLWTILRLYQSPCVPVAKRSSAYDDCLVDGGENWFTVTPAERKAWKAAEKRKEYDTRNPLDGRNQHPQYRNPVYGLPHMQKDELTNTDAWAERRHKGGQDPWTTVTLRMSGHKRRG